MKYLKMCFLILSTILMLSACDNNANNFKNSKEEFTDNVDEIINVIKKNKYDKNNFSSYYNYYELLSNKLVGYKFNSEKFTLDHNLEYDVSNMNLNNIKIIENKIGELYVSIKNDEYCAIKSFKDEYFNVYDVNDYEKCNIDVIDGEEITVDIVGFEIGTKTMYFSEKISNNSLELTVFTNILDNTNCSYRWFRDGVEIKNSNVSKYFINNDENAYYSVEVTTADGKKIKSNSIHVIVKK